MSMCIDFKCDKICVLMNVYVLLLRSWKFCSESLLWFQETLFWLFIYQIIKKHIDLDIALIQWSNNTLNIYSNSCRHTC